MKYTINSINQLGIVEHGLSEKTDLIDWVMLDFIFEWQQNPKALSLNGMVWFGYKNFVEQMPLIGIKDKSAISRRIKNLKELGLIDTFYDHDNSKIFVKTTEFYFGVTRFKAGDTSQYPLTKNNGGVDEEQRGVDEEQRGVDEEQRGVDEEQRISNISNINNKSKITDKSLCAAAEAATQSIFIEIPLNVKNTFHKVTLTDVEKYKSLYPAVDVEQQLRNMAGWSDANPKNRKTKDGIGRFINAWLSKAQNQARPVQTSSQQSSSNQASSHYVYTPSVFSPNYAGGSNVINGSCEVVS